MGDVSPRDYYSRQLRVPGWGEPGQRALGSATVLVVGLGGLGCPAAASLARSGVGRLVVVDPDRVEASNLPRQSLYTVADVGALKVEAGARALGAANPWVAVEARAEAVDASNVRALVEAADLVVEGTDNFATKFLVHDACRSAGVPLVAASLHQWEAQVTLFAFDRPGAGCWRCLYPQAPVDGCVGVCAETGVAGALAGLAGQALALAAVRHLLGLPGPEACTTLVVDGADGTTQRLKWKPDPACACARGPGDWSWLDSSHGKPPREVTGDQVPWDSRPLVVVDLRDEAEIGPDDWPWMANRLGGEVVHAPWSRWSTSAPVWNPEAAYLLVCARGYRSFAALDTVPPGVTARSLRGGVAALVP